MFQVIVVYRHRTLDGSFTGISIPGCYYNMKTKGHSKQIREKVSEKHKSGAWIQKNHMAYGRLCAQVQGSSLV